jgi:hypothetical protein
MAVSTSARVRATTAVISREAAINASVVASRSASLGSTVSTPPP